MSLSQVEINAIKIELHQDTSIFDPRSGQWYDRNATPIPAPAIIVGGYCEWKWVAGGPTLFQWALMTKCTNPAHACHPPIAGIPMPVGTIIRTQC